MTNAILIAGGAIAFSLCACVAAPGPDGESCTLAVEHVSVLPMDSDRILDDQTVKIAGDRILRLGPASTLATAGCLTAIDGRGLFLAPGLIDSHTHVETTAFAEAFGAQSRPIDFPAVLAPYVAHGVTGVRVMSGAPDLLAFRLSGDGVHPRLVVASPMLSGDPPVLPEPATKVVRTPEEARRAIRHYAAEGYDFIKVRDNLTAPVFRAVIDHAARAGLYVDGHIQRSREIGVDEVLASGQKGFAHIDNFALALTEAEADMRGFIDALLACGCFVATTLSVEANAIRQIDDYEAMLARPEMRFVHPLLKNAFWLKPNNPYASDSAQREFFASLLAADQRLVKAFSDAGVRLVAGTDALSPMIIPGLSLHDELGLLVEAGLTPYEALGAATSNPAAFVPGFEGAGVVADGRRADLLLVEGNPLADLGVLRRPAAVILGGRFITRAELDQLLEEAAASYEIE